MAPLEPGFYEIHRWSVRLELPEEAAPNPRVLAREPEFPFSRKKPQLWNVELCKDGTYTLKHFKAPECAYLGIVNLSMGSHLPVIGSNKPRRWILRPFGKNDRYFIVLAREKIVVNNQLFELAVDLPNWEQSKTALRPLDPSHISQSWVFMRVKA